MSVLKAYHQIFYLLLLRRSLGSNHLDTYQRRVIRHQFGITQLLLRAVIDAGQVLH